MGPRDPSDGNEEDDPTLVEGDEGRLDEGSDAGSLDDRGGPERETGQEIEGEEAESRLDRSARRDAQLREELRAAREHNLLVQQELNALRQEREQRQQQRFQQEETDESFNARISHLDPVQQMDLKLDRANRRNAQMVALSTFAAADRADKAAYDSRANTDANRRRLAAKVEQILQVERRQGRDFPRETIYKFILGEERDTALSKGTTAREGGQRRIAREQARTVGGSGDAQRDQRPRRYAANDMSPEAVRARLNQPDAFI